MNTRAGLSLGILSVAFSLAVLFPQPFAFAQAAVPQSQSDQDHNAHHPGTAAEAAPVTTPPTTPAPAQSGRSPIGMGMMGPGGQPRMMEDMRQMMSMMRNMMSMMSTQTGMMSADVEGRIAALKTELKIADAQTPQWHRFAEALRAVAKSMNTMHEQMMQSGITGTLPARLERYEKMASAHLDAMRTLKDALDPLYAALSDEQKKRADGLMIGPMGMM